MCCKFAHNMVQYTQIVLQMLQNFTKNVFGFLLTIELKNEVVTYTHIFYLSSFFWEVNCHTWNIFPNGLIYFHWKFSFPLATFSTFNRATCAALRLTCALLNNPRNGRNPRGESCPKGNSVFFIEFWNIDAIFNKAYWNNRNTQPEHFTASRFCFSWNYNVAPCRYWFSAKCLGYLLVKIHINSFP